QTRRDAWCLGVSRHRAPAGRYLALEAVELIAQQPTRAHEVLTELLPRTFRADWGMVAIRPGDDLCVPSETSAAPELVPACRDWFPLTEVPRLAAPPSWGGSTLLGA